MLTALVTGASRGVGKGVATALSDAGFRVFATGRTIAQSPLPSPIIRLPCDHTRDEDTAAVFDRIAQEAGGVDLVVNSAWAGYERMVDAQGTFTWTLPFWQQPAYRWTSMMDAGVRAAFVVSQHAARLMIPQGRENVKGFLKEHLDIRTAIEDRVRRELGLVREQEPQPV